MSKYTFDQIVAARAEERVSKKIMAFRSDIVAALNKAGIEHQYGTWGGRSFGPTEARTVMRVLAAEDTTKGWPNGLWERERETVAEELLSTMDEMQRALIAAQRPVATDADQPEGEDHE